MRKGQAYDNASTMAGIHSGAQCRIKQVNSKAIFIPWVNHLLNLASVHAVASSEHSATFFFAVVERVYFFFSASTCCKSLNNEDLCTSALEELQGLRSFFKRNDLIKLLYCGNLVKENSNPKTQLN